MRIKNINLLSIYNLFLLFLNKDKNIMNNDKLKQIIFILVVIIVILFTTLAIIVTNHLTREQTKQTETKTIVITDTITKLVFDTVYFDRFVTKKLQLTDTLYRDSVRIDSVIVRVPISTYKLDTVFQTDSTRLNLHIINSGYDVKLDSLYYMLEYTTPPVKLPKKNYFREHFRFGVGFSAGYGFFTKKPDIFVGLGFYYCF